MFQKFIPYNCLGITEYLPPLLICIPSEEEEEEEEEEEVFI